jgi:hypothetical protein
MKRAGTQTFQEEISIGIRRFNTKQTLKKSHNNDAKRNQYALRYTTENALCVTDTYTVKKYHTLATEVIDN